MNAPAQLAPASQEPITSGVRSDSVDIVKGVAIFLVVYGHTAQGLQHHGWWPGPAAAFSDAFIYSFHMPAFFFVAGLFVMSSIVKRGNRRFVIDKTKTILYPYLLFAIAEPIFEPLIGRFKLSSPPFQWNSFVLKLTDGEAIWFLFTLFLCLMVALLTKAIPAWLRFLGAVFVSVLPVYGPPFLARTAHEFCFVALGMWVGKGIFRLRQVTPAAATFGFVLLAAFQAAMIRQYGYVSLNTYIELGLTGTAGLFLLSRLLESSSLGGALAWVGRASLAIFLLSPYLQGAMREILLFLGIPQFWPQLLVPTFFAVLLPAIVWHQKDRWRVGWLFQWPF